MIKVDLHLSVIDLSTDTSVFVYYETAVRIAFFIVFLMGARSQNITTIFMAYLCEFYGERNLHKGLSCLNLFLQTCEVKSFEFDVSDDIPAKVENISPLVSFAYFC